LLDNLISHESTSENIDCAAFLQHDWFFISFCPTDGSILFSIAVQPDGKIIIGGSFTSYNGTAINRIARLNADGSLDNTFNPGSGTNNTLHSIALQPDGKIIIGGSFTSYNGTAINRIARLNADGSLDNTFNPGSGTNNTLYSIALQPDGKIIIGGGFTSYNGTTRNSIARLNSDGTLDNTLNPGTGTNGFLRSISLQPDGKIVIGGWFSFYGGESINCIARLNVDGTLDNTFNPGAGANNNVLSTALQSDGKIVIGGDFSSYNMTTQNYIARLNVDGTLDNTFNPGTGASHSIRNIALQPDGKIIIGGYFVSYNWTARRRIARLNVDGTLDNTFNPGTGANGAVNSIALQPDGKIIIGGEFISFNDTTRRRIARLNVDGTLDNTFNPGTGAGSTVHAIALQPDGKIIIGGYFIDYTGTARNRIARLNNDGTLDNTFNPGSGASDAVYSITLQSDGKIIIGGLFLSYNWTARMRIARLNADGSLDNTFNPGTGVSGDVNSIALQPDGKIIIGGGFTSYNGTTRNSIARLNSDGTLDNTFNPGTGANGAVNSIALQPDGKIIIGGGFTLYNGTAINRIARLNSDGTLDNTFNPGTGVNGVVNSIALQPDGKIIIGGGFTLYNGTAINRIARLNSDGTLDNTFNTGTGANNWITSTFLQSDGKIIIGGWFTSYNDIGRNRIARLLPDCEVSHTDTIISCDPYTWIDGITYTESNFLATVRIVGGATNGCDSVEKLHLTIPVFEFTEYDTISDGGYNRMAGKHIFSARHIYSLISEFSRM
jgi:uncharacterized delta-60 repeat protein